MKGSVAKIGDHNCLAAHYQPRHLPSDRTDIYPMPESQVPGHGSGHVTSDRL